MIQLLLGVPFETVLAEYLRTNDDTGPRLEQLITTLCLATFAPALGRRLQLIVTTQPEYLTEIHERVLAAHGSVERYLAEACGVTRSTVQQLQQRLLAS
jgi:protein-tyrosine phosphatase